jgi:hypothetical protein
MEGRKEGKKKAAWKEGVGKRESGKDAHGRKGGLLLLTFSS